MVRRLAGTFSAHSVFSAALPGAHPNFPGLRFACASSHDERTGGIFPGANCRPVRTLPSRIRISEHSALPALLSADARPRQGSEAARVAADAAIRRESARDAEHHLHLDESGRSLLHRDGVVVLPGRMAKKRQRPHHGGICVARRRPVGALFGRTVYRDPHLALSDSRVVPAPEQVAGTGVDRGRLRTARRDVAAVDFGSLRVCTPRSLRTRP